MKYKGPVLLLITATLWGMAFVAQTVGGGAVGAFTFNASRNFIGVLFLTGVIAWRKRTGIDQPPTDDEGGYSRRTLVVAGASCGIVLFLAAWLQQAGINAYPAGAAASGRSGFITALYMVIVALYGGFPWPLWACTCSAFQTGLAACTSETSSCFSARLATPPTSL